ncbi:hypothetical protein [Streptomyces parvus]|uniref:hypothetical protein n=1 Tax=Streptomyces parvus TaxID=66428 RepID=UPI0033E159AB
MVDAFDVARALRGGIPDRARAWAFVRDFAAAWAEPLADSAGTRPEELERAEETLGLALPTALREAYSLLGARHDLTGNQDPLLRPSELFVHDEFGGVLVFRSENQGCAFRGVRRRDLGQDDPPVFVQSREGNRKPTNCLSRHPRACLDAWKVCESSVTAVGAVALGHARSLPYAVAFGALIGLTSGITAAVTGALVQTETDPRYPGRVTSVTTLCALGLAPVFFPVAGVTVAVWGAAMFFTVCGGICLLAAVFGVAVPVLRRAELRKPGAEPAPSESASPSAPAPPSESASTSESAPAER